MAIQIPTREELAAEFRAEYEAAFNTVRSVARGTDGWLWSRIISGVAWGIVARLVTLEDNALPDRSVGEWLRRWAWLFSVPFKGPVKATGKNVLLVTGAIGAPVVAGTELAANDGTLYVITTPLTLGPGGSLASIAARNGGISGNRAAGESLVFTAPPMNVDTNATIVADITSGNDGESEADYRPRLLDHLRRPLSGGAVGDFRKWATGDQGGAAAAYVYRHRRGRGTLDLALLQAGAGAGRVMADTSAAAAVIDELRPANMKDVVILNVVPTLVNVKAALELDATVYAWDWVDGGGVVITAANLGAKTVTVPGCPAGAVAGARVQIAGVQSKIVGRVGNVLTLDSLAGTPVGHTLYAGGDLVEPVQASIRRYFNTFGPARGAYGVGHWADAVRRAKISEAATTVAGVVDAEVIAPANNVTPIDDYSTSIPLLVPGIIEVVQ